MPQAFAWAMQLLAQHCTPPRTSTNALTASACSHLLPPLLQPPPLTLLPPLRPLLPPPLLLPPGDLALDADLAMHSSTHDQQQ
jgi:hypothetical protein